ncbi:hypothetical protein C6I21_15465 [Alkalicoccus urumqiensis]|uniref:Uncharacterized protein n=1 Tax=Alkalicoccus urumqiensis TaxID=1548213 RepID=A0A2P6MDI5_ALKUR|nr:hypothetical protein C6I21_15465 [Alkalicoccus urumqiensis]
MFLYAAVLTACSNEEAVPFVEEEEETVELIVGSQESSFNAERYEHLTKEALLIYDASQAMDEQNEWERRWFVRYYIQMHEYNENWSTDEMLQLAEERVEFETAWRLLARHKYDVSASPEEIEEQAAYSMELFSTDTPASIQGMADGMNMTVEEFFIQFDRDHLERSVMWEDLSPLVAESYRREDDTLPMDAAQLFNEEVLAYMEETALPEGLPEYP